MQVFKKSRALTLGVEEEYTLCEPGTGKLVPGVDSVMDVIPGELKPRVSRELMKCCLEMNTPICENADDVLEHTKSLRKTLLGYARASQMELLSLGTHPLAELKNLETTDSEHYRWVRGQCAYSATRMISCGLHVHVGTETPEQQLYLFRSLRRWLPVLMALAANSPFLEGGVTGFASSRYLLFGNMPRTGYPPPIKDYDELEVYIESMKKAGSITKPGDLWWLVRPQPPLGTVEIRAMDAQSTAEDTAAFAGLIQALSASLIEDFGKKLPEQEPSPYVLADNHWKAARFGMSCRIVDPCTGDVRSMEEEAELLLSVASRHAKNLAADGVLERIREIIADGNGASRLMNRLQKEEGGNLASLTVKLLSEFLN